MHSGDLIAQKKELRNRMRRLRDSMSLHDIHSKSSAIQAKLWQLIEEYKFASLMFYIAFGSEVRTQDCIERSIESGLTTIVPVCSIDGSRHLIPSHLLDLHSEVAEGRFNVPEPRYEFRRPFPPEKIDLVVVPGLAFDERGYRIGFGAGYYDRFLPSCPQAKLFGLAYEIQIVDSTFPAGWDIPVHKIITEERTIHC